MKVLVCYSPSPCRAFSSAAARDTEGGHSETRFGLIFNNNNNTHTHTKHIIQSADP
jgi:hypothetical protein